MDRWNRKSMFLSLSLQTPFPLSKIKLKNTFFKCVKEECYRCGGELLSSWGCKSFSTVHIARKPRTHFLWQPKNKTLYSRGPCHGSGSVLGNTGTQAREKFMTPAVKELKIYFISEDLIVVKGQDNIVPSFPPPSPIPMCVHTCSC